MSEDIKSVGGIWIADNLVPQTGISTTPVPMEGWEDGYGEESGPDVVAGRLYVKNEGTYLLQAQISFSGSASTIFQFHIYHYGVETPFGTHRALGSGDVGSASILGMCKHVQADDYFEIWVSTFTGEDKQIITVDATLIAVQIN